MDRTPEKGPRAKGPGSCGTGEPAPASIEEADPRGTSAVGAAGQAAVTLPPRTRNGWVDDGSLVQASNQLDKCPNCGSRKYTETISREECRSCGLRCDYWGEGANEVYEAMMARNHAQRQAERERQEQEQTRRDEWAAKDHFWQNQGQDHD